MISTETATCSYHKAGRIFTAYKRNNFPGYIVFILDFALYLLCRVAPIIIKTLAINTVYTKNLDISMFNFRAKGFNHPPVLIIIKTPQPRREKYDGCSAMPKDQ